MRTGMSSPCRTHSTTCRDAEDTAAGPDGGKLHSNSTAPPTFPSTSAPSLVTVGFVRRKITVNLLLYVIKWNEIIWTCCALLKKVWQKIKKMEILTKQAIKCHHSASLQIWSRWPHICHSYNLQHVQSVGKRDTIVTITLLPWPNARRQPSVTDFQTKKATAGLPLLS